MYHRIKNTLAGLAVAVATLGLSWTIGQPPTVADQRFEAVAAGLESAALDEAGEVARKRARGMRSQATMPFFSFALLPKREG